MSENETSKSKEKRLEETEKLKAELERSLAVAKVKSAHKQIEDTEKLRKRSVTLSICSRITNLMGSINCLKQVFCNPKFRTLSVPEGVVLNIEAFEQTYVSITYDFQKNLDLGEEAMTKMFPMQKVRKDSVDHATTDLINLSHQLQQMFAYCERLLY
ncbi:MAG TPA: hypothetical protein VMW36_04655 [Patescibacteria group bacterium]|nr:hypothetical protein [Patescibacteria group bacterium]